MNFVCPQPGVWARIHQALVDAWRAAGAEGDAPPVPLILAGWAYSNDSDKHSRWLATIDWAAGAGLASLIPELRSEERYEVAEFSTYAIGPGYGPMHLPWSFEPKPVPAPGMLATALRRLEENWSSIACETLSHCTKPSRFSGRKGRRLVVSVTGSAQPPWGAWDRLATGSARRSFTALRTKINEAIAPHMVDHVEFQVENEALGKGGPTTRCT